MRFSNWGSKWRGLSVGQAVYDSLEDAKISFREGTLAVEIPSPAEEEEFYEKLFTSDLGGGHKRLVFTSRYLLTD